MLSGLDHLEFSRSFSTTDGTLTSREGDILHRHWGESSSELSSRITNYIRYVIDDGALTEWFLDKGADPNATCEWGRTPMSDAMCRASFVTIHMLFARGADIRQGQLLHNAVLRDGPEHEVIELVELLLGKGATINEIQYENHPQTFAELQDFLLGTPLHYAAQAGKEMVVSYLLNKGADPLIRNTKGRTVIEAAGHTNQSAVVQMLSHV
jgi:ankyrin repeat protein